MAVGSSRAGGGRKFSFLEDQDFQRKRDEAAAAALADQKYQYGWRDVLLFMYFCMNVSVVGISMLNSNALMKMWRLTEAFRNECTTPDYEGSWCPEQADCAKVTLVLFQSAAAAAAMLGGTVVDTFTASMGLLVAHIMYAAGAHLLSKPGTRGIFVAAVLQGGAGELLLNSVLPICGLFGRHQNTMMLVLTFFFDLSACTYPMLLHFVPRSPLADVQTQFYATFHSYVVWIVIGCAVVGTFVLPVDDTGAIVPVTTMATLQSVNRKPPGTLASGPFQRVVGQDFRDVEVIIDNAHEDDFDEDDLSAAAAEEGSSLLLPSATDVEGTSRKRSLAALRFTKKLCSMQFLISLVIFSATVTRNSFYLNNSQALQEAAGDSGVMAQAFMWILGLGTLFSPLAWQLNDTYSTSSVCLILLCSVSFLVNLLVALKYRILHWGAMLCWVPSRSLLAPTILTHAARCFGFKHLPGIAVVIGLAGAFLNFLNVSIDRYTETRLQGDYTVANYIMLALGVLVWFCVGLQRLFPAPPADDTNNQIAAERGSVAIDNKPPDLRHAQQQSQPTLRGRHVAGGIEDEDEWEDEEVVMRTARASAGDK